MSEAPASGLEAVKFPLPSYVAAAQHLRRPFTAEAVKWKVQAGTLVVPYIDARLVTERLNHVVPGLWADDYEPLSGGKGLLCRLTVDGITRLDVGSDYTGKGLYSDAFKRAAVKFGVGVSLYALPKVFLDTKGGHLKEKTVKEKKVFELTPSGRERLHSGYRAWLKETGTEMFGPVLDHGDVADAFGDVDADAPAPSSDVLASDDEQPEKLTDAKASALIEGAEKLFSDLPKAAKGDLLPATFRRQLASAWHSYEELEKLIASLEKRKGEASV